MSNQRKTKGQVFLIWLFFGLGVGTALSLVGVYLNETLEHVRTGAGEYILKDGYEFQEKLIAPLGFGGLGWLVISTILFIVLFIKAPAGKKKPQLSHNCTTCGNTLSKNAQICPSCDTVVNPKNIKCRKCGHKLNVDEHSTCPKCGETDPHIGTWFFGRVYVFIMVAFAVGILALVFLS